MVLLSIMQAMCQLIIFIKISYLSLSAFIIPAKFAGITLSNLNIPAKNVWFKAA